MAGRLILDGPLSQGFQPEEMRGRFFSARRQNQIHPGPPQPIRPGSSSKKASVKTWGHRPSSGTTGEPSHWCRRIFPSPQRLEAILFFRREDPLLSLFCELVSGPRGGRRSSLTTKTSGKKLHPRFTVTTYISGANRGDQIGSFLTLNATNTRPILLPTMKLLRRPEFCAFGQTFGPLRRLRFFPAGVSDGPRGSIW